MSKTTSIPAVAQDVMRAEELSLAPASAAQVEADASMAEVVSRLRHSKPVVGCREGRPVGTLGPLDVLRVPEAGWP
ncbi:MAG: hypothetical protein ACYCW6_12940 [Candidatus Xenobia bacterium]